MKQPEYKREDGGDEERGGWFCAAKAVPQAKPLRETRKYRERTGRRTEGMQERG